MQSLRFHPDQQEQNLYFNQIPQDTLKFEKHPSMGGEGPGAVISYNKPFAGLYYFRFPHVG